MGHKNRSISGGVIQAKVSLTERPNPRSHMFEEKREAIIAIEAVVLPLMPIPKALAT